MLRDLNIQNFALIDNLQIQLQPGLNILTGETGAGKSIIIDAIGILLGGRALTDYIRTGQSKAVIEAIFDIKGNQNVKHFMQEIGIETDGEQLLLRREITESGNNRLRINGQFATRNLVKELSKYLLDIHGQNEHQTLMQKHEHLRLLDEYGGEDIKQLKKEVQRFYHQLTKIKSELKSLRQNEQEKAQRLDLIKFQIDEIDQADLRIDEEEELLNRRKILMNAEKLFTNANGVNELLAGSGFESVGALDLVGKVKKALEEMALIDQNLDQVLVMISNAYYQLEEASFEMGGYKDNIEFDQAELTKIEERLSLIGLLKRKYGQTIEEVLNYRHKIGTELSTLTNSEERIEELESELQHTSIQYIQKAKKLSESRNEIAVQFAWKVMGEMRELSMENAKFVIQLKWQELNEGLEIDGISYQFGPDGLDQAEFLISPNPGEPLKPLIKVASGGEISRIMLAIKAVTIDLEQVNSVIFDEIDSGVGGEAGQKVAEKLALISRGKQVICITHLPQIAAMADAHYHIFKEVKDNRTSSNLTQLDDKERIEELARMYGGTEIAAALQHASEMLKLAIDKKANL